MSKRLYVAYGSNLNISQMKYRCPGAKLYGTGEISGYELQFKGQPHGAFATIAPKEGASVPVAVWEISQKNEQALDRYEGYPRHYIKEAVTVQTADGSKIPVMAYIMAEPMCRQPALPYPRYYRTIQQGFEANGLPVDSLRDAWSRTIDEVWSGRIDKPKRAPERNRGPER